jgi:alpha-D-ribose 1-methylphosphonate 5-triphosphate synthase subunit PhnG
MFHAFDNLEPNQPTTRAAWMALLARSPQHLLASALPQDVDSQLQWLRRPETGLMMVQGRIGGTGARFNVGEITITRCALRIGSADNGTAVGVSYVLGRNHRQAQLAAVADALLQDPAQRERLEVTLLDPIRQHLRQWQAQRQQRALTTKVDFLTVARESTGNDEEDDA